MNVEKTEDKVVVEFENDKVKYDRNQWSDEQTYLSSEGAFQLEEWKIDLIKNHGVGLDELQS